MDLMNGIARLSMQMKAAEVARNYSVALMDKAMETAELSAETLLEDMLPAAAPVPKGEFIDVFV